MNSEPSPAQLLALRLGHAAFNGPLALDELRYPSLARQAKNLLKNNPLLYGQILEDLLDGLTPDLTARKRHTSPQLIRFLSRLHPEIDAALKAHTIRNLELALVHAADRLLNDIDQIPVAQLPRTVQILTEQLALISGNPTARVEHLSSPPLSREKLLQLFNELKSPKTT